MNDVSDEHVARAVRNGVSSATDYDALADVDCVSISVPTPLPGRR